MLYSPKRISICGIEDITEAALIGTIEIAQMQPRVHCVGSAVFEQKMTQKNRIKVYTCKSIEDLPFKYNGFIATINEFLERVDDYLVCRRKYFANVRDLREGGRIFGHIVRGVLYEIE